LRIFNIKQVKQSLEGLWRFQEVWAPTVQNNWHMKVTRLSALGTGHPYPPGNIPGTRICYRLIRLQGHSAARRMSIKNSSDNIGNRTRDLPVCRAVLQPTVLTSPSPRMFNIIQKNIYKLSVLVGITYMIVPLSSSYWGYSHFFIASAYGLQQGSNDGVTVFHLTFYYPLFSSDLNFLQQIVTDLLATVYPMMASSCFDLCACMKINFL